MNIESILKQMEKCYLNCFLPSNDYLVKSISDYVGFCSTIEERDNEHVVVNLGKDEIVSVQMKLRKGSNDRLLVSSISAL